MTPNNQVIKCNTAIRPVRFILLFMFCILYTIETFICTNNLDIIKQECILQFAHLQRPELGCPVLLLLPGLPDCVLGLGRRHEAVVGREEGGGARAEEAARPLLYTRPRHRDLAVEGVPGHARLQHRGCHAACLLFSPSEGSVINVSENQDYPPVLRAV